MAQAERIKIPRASDRAVIDFFREVGKLHGVTSISVSAYGQTQIGGVDLEAEPSEDFKTLMELDSELILAASALIDGLNVAYYRGGASPEEKKSPIWDEVHLNFNPQQGSMASGDRLRIVQRVNSKLHGSQPGRRIDAGITREQGDLLAIHQSSLDRLEKLNEDLIRQGIEYRAVLDKKFSDKVDELDDNHATRTGELETAFRKKEEALAEDRKKLEAKQNEIDDRDNTHVRRELRKDLLDEVKARSAEFALTTGTQRLRSPIHAACVVFFGISLWFAFGYSKELFAYVQGNPVSVITSVILSLKSLGFTFAAVATGIFYIRWLNQWFTQHAEAEFQLKQFQLDIDRASWAVETVLEMKAGADVMPTALLNSITTNLFEYDRGVREEDMHPADELASALLGTATNVKVKAGDAELRFSGKDLKKEMRKK